LRLYGHSSKVIATLKEQENDEISPACRQAGQVEYKNKVKFFKKAADNLMNSKARGEIIICWNG